MNLKTAGHATPKKAGILRLGATPVHSTFSHPVPLSSFSLRCPASWGTDHRHSPDFSSNLLHIQRPRSLSAFLSSSLTSPGSLRAFSPDRNENHLLLLFWLPTLLKPSASFWKHAAVLNLACKLSCIGTQRYEMVTLCA